MRGKETTLVISDTPSGITPAYAGKRGSGSLPRSCRRDHPRVCGEKISQTRRNLPLGGSPPRVRGKVRCIPKQRNTAGITPACAGKSQTLLYLPGLPRDHPRVCGEKLLAIPCLHLRLGSPPRVRGKVVPAFVLAHVVGITPACAGKRFAIPCAPMLVKGSPPRVRGKADANRMGPHKRGITPACAGKSRLRSLVHKFPWDHPRVCGEKKDEIWKKGYIQGSPPRVRGKGTLCRSQRPTRGITPACAGKR